MSTKKRAQKASVTILTVKHVYPRETSELTLAFASRERAIEALKLHTTSADATTTITIRTLGVISDE